MKKFKAIQIFIIMSLIITSIGLGLMMSSIGVGLTTFGISTLILSPAIFGIFNNDCF